MAKALSHWNVDVSYAEHGLTALEAIRIGKGDVLFLDLNMPIMDGYQVLERIRAEDLPTMVIVVSGDIQPEARRQVLAMGALDFIQKPFSEEIVSDVLRRYGLLSELQDENDELPLEDTAVILPDYYQEIANVAMGRAGDRLARFLDAFVHLPVPVVASVTRTELEQQLRTSADQGKRVVSQGFVGAGIAGEAMISLPPESFESVAELLKLNYEATTEFENEMLMDLANILIGAFLQSFARQLDIEFSCGTPVLLPAMTSLPSGGECWKETLSITIEYGLNEQRNSCELMLVFSEESLEPLRKLSKFF
jgi:chemotaxis protein CheY-P-specific phosphatase CheC